MRMRHHRLGLTGLMLLAGCGASPTLPPAATVAAPPAPPATQPEAAAPPAPVEAKPAPAPEAPAAESPAEPPAAPPLAFSPPAVDAPAPPPVASSGGGGGGGGGGSRGGGARPAAPSVRLSFSEIKVDSQMQDAPKEGLADRNTDTRWTSRARSGGWAQVKLPEAQRLFAVSLSMPPGMRYNLFTSDDGETWAQRGWGLVNKSWTAESKRLPTHTPTRYVRVAQAGPATADRPFAIRELRVHVDPGVQVAALPAPPPWGRPAGALTEANIRKASLGYLSEGHTDTPLHIHAYMRVWYNGQQVAVPANLGIASGRMAHLHTHDTTGTVHMEGPLGMRFNLGQVFTLWGVPLTGAKVYVDGAPVANPAALHLTDKLSLDVVFGRPPVGVADVPLD